MTSSYRKPRVLIAVVLSLTAISLLTSLVIHLPGTSIPAGLEGIKYSDIVYGVFLNIFSPGNIGRPDKINSRWYNWSLYVLFIKGDVRYCPLPYVHYFLEYPPLVALIILLSTCISFSVVLPSKCSYPTYLELINKVAQYHLIINAIVISVFAFLMMIYLIKLVKDLGLECKVYRLTILPILPSFILYSIYNWDVIASSLYVMSLYYLCKKRYLLAALLLSFSVLTKLLPLLFLIVIIILAFKCDVLTQLRKNLLKYLMVFSLPILLSVTPILVISPAAILDFISYHGKWYCENCIYQILIRDINSPIHRLIASVLILTSLMFVCFKAKIVNFKDLAKIALIVAIAVTTLNYIFTPQMILLIAPLAVVLLDRAKLALYIVSDIANCLIMIFFFMDAEIRRALNMYLGLNLSACFNPWLIDSPIQWLATVRNIILLIILVSLMYAITKRN